MVEDLRKLPMVRHAAQVETMEKIYGKRIIIVGGGAQVGQVALGAILEADRHNIRGEHISIDTIPLVGEEPLAAAVRAAGRLPRVKAIVMAGSLMGGDIENAVREVRAQGLLVVSLNMAGSVPDAADLVVTDPVQAGVMTVMAVADTAKFTCGPFEAAGVSDQVPSQAVRADSSWISRRSVGNSSAALRSCDSRRRVRCAGRTRLRARDAN